MLEAITFLRLGLSFGLPDGFYRMGLKIEVCFFLNLTHIIITEKNICGLTNKINIHNSAHPDIMTRDVLIWKLPALFFSTYNLIEMES